MYLFIGTATVGYLFFFSQPIAVLTKQEIAIGQLIGYALNVSLIVMVSVIFFKSSRHRKMATQENLRELVSVSKILDTISSNVGDGIYKSKVAGGFVYMNDAFVRLFSIPDKKSFLNGDQHRLFNTPEEREEIIDELIEFHSISNKLISFKRFDESRFWGRLSCTLLEEDGEQFIVGTISDVTIQQEHESMLRESENQLREVQQLRKLVIGSCLTRVRIYDGLRSAFEFMDLALFRQITIIEIG
ncbi:PAS domain-containing protein [bacterium]|nr:PAS domain-containing protein [bacterium]